MDMNNVMNLNIPNRSKFEESLTLTDFQIHLKASNLSPYGTPWGACDRTSGLVHYPTREGRFTHELGAMTMRLWEPKRKYPKAVPRPPPTSWSVVTGPQSVVCSHMWPSPKTKCYFNDILFIWVLTHGKLEYINGYDRSNCHDLTVLC